MKTNSFFKKQRTSERAKRTRRLICIFAIICAVAINATAQLSWSGEVVLNNGDHITQSITLTGDVYIYVLSGDIATISGVISGSGIVRKFGAGTLILNGANTFSGKLEMGNGTLRLGTSGTINNSYGVYFFNSDYLFIS